MSSVDKTFGLCPSTVSSQRERKRVSHANSPSGSLSEASMSPRKSLTTKLFPSRTLIVVFSPIVFASQTLIGKEPLAYLRQAKITCDFHLPLHEQCGWILLSHHHAVEVFPAARKHAVCSCRLSAHRQRPVFHGDEPASCVSDIPTDGSRDIMKQGFVATLGKSREECFGCINHRSSYIYR